MLTSRTHAVMRHAGLTGPNDDEVQDVRTEIVPHAVLHAAPCAQQQHQHENAPEHTEGGQHGPQFVLPQREQDFLQTVQHDQPATAACETPESCVEVDQAVLQEDLALGLFDDVLLVGNDDHGVAAPMDILDERHDLLRGVTVERARGFVRENHLGLVHQCARDGDALLLPTRQLIGHEGLAIGQARPCPGTPPRDGCVPCGRHPGNRAAAPRSPRRS